MRNPVQLNGDKTNMQFAECNQYSIAYGKFCRCSWNLDIQMRKGFQPQGTPLTP